jgi:transposase
MKRSLPSGRPVVSWRRKWQRGSSATSRSRAARQFGTRCSSGFTHGIPNHCEHPIGTSALEGANNHIKVLKRKAYGFHEPEYFALKVKQALPGRKLTTETGGEPYS